MNIALIGYGKMGKAIEQIAIARGHNIGLIIDLSNAVDFTTENLNKCDVAIEFTSPHTAFENVSKLMVAKIPTICGSTGWNENIAAAEAKCNENKTALLVASNFSLGVNVFFAINKYLSQLIAGKGYTATVEEIHHTAKKDAPSGTAITIAEQMLENNKDYQNWHLEGDKNEALSIPITAKRIDPAPGTHIVNYASDIDDITITHTAHSRAGFALGAVVAAEFIAGKQGVFNMQQVLGITS